MRMFMVMIICFPSLSYFRQAVRWTGTLPSIWFATTSTLLLMSEGLANPEIAGRLFVSTATVKTHVNAIFGKLLVATRAQAIARLRP